MILWQCIYLVTVGLCGWALLAAVIGAPRRRLAELVAVALALGVGAVPLVLLWISMLGIKPSRITILAMAAAAIVAIIALYKSRRLPRIDVPLIPKLSAVDFLLLPAAVLVGLQIAGAVAAASMPIYDMDALSIWGLKAKVLLLEPLHPRPAYFSDLSLTYSHLDYPLLVPMLWAGAYAAMGEIHEGAAKLTLVLPLLALVGVLYASLRQCIGRLRAALLTALVAGLPGIPAVTGVGLADITLAMFLLGAVVFTVRWMRDNRHGDAVLAGIFAAMASCTKLEGLVVVGSCIAVFTAATLGGRRRIRGWLIAACAVAVVFGPWLAWSWSLPRTHENYAGRLGVAAVWAGLDRLGHLGRLMLPQLRRWPWSGTILLLVLSAIIGWRGWRRPHLLAAWFIFATQLAAYVTAFLITPWNLDELVQFSSPRLLLHLAPLAVLLAGLHWQAVTASCDDSACPA